MSITMDDAVVRELAAGISGRVLSPATPGTTGPAPSTTASSTGGRR